MTESGTLSDVAVNDGLLGARAGWWNRRPRRSARLVAVAALAAAIGALGGYAVRDRSATVTVRVGEADSTPYQIGIASKGWAYAVPLHVSWRDLEGTWHDDSSRPACLPPTGQIESVVFGTVNVTGPGGLSWRQVVWIDCGASAAP
jgi:hypothetical protein